MELSLWAKNAYIPLAYKGISIYLIPEKYSILKPAEVRSPW